MEQLVILVVIGLISFVNWLMQRSAELRERQKLERKKEGLPEGNPFQEQEPESPEPQAAPSRPVADPGAEMRKLMEALGLPIEDEPTTVFVPERPAPPPLPVAAEVRPVERAVFVPKPTPVTRSLSEDAARRRIAEAAEPVHASPLMVALRSRDGVRQAIVLREILGPPKAFSA
ncbi:MAG: hypothetical protein ACOYNN_05395 [Terrimicrobiaceae bacterium]